MFFFYQNKVDDLKTRKRCEERWT